MVLIHANLETLLENTDGCESNFQKLFTTVKNRHATCTCFCIDVKIACKKFL